jgi:hypothetical protein
MTRREVLLRIVAMFVVSAIASVIYIGIDYGSVDCGVKLMIDDIHERSTIIHLHDFPIIVVNDGGVVKSFYALSLFNNSSMKGCQIIYLDNPVSLKFSNVSDAILFEPCWGVRYNLNGKVIKGDGEKFGAINLISPKYNVDKKAGYVNFYCHDKQQAIQLFQRYIKKGRRLWK